MPHVDEGRLSEYLDRVIDGSSDRLIDGSWDRVEIEAHLAECVECRERLEELRALRARADALLRRDAPASVPVPGFEEIEARARARRGAGPRRVLSLRRLTALGWAATIVLAVGIGWIARGVVMRPAGSAPVRPDGVPTAVGGMDAPAESAAARRGAAALPEERREAEPAGRAGAAADQTPQLAAAPPAAVELRQQANEAAPPPAAGAVAKAERPAAKAETAEGLRTRQAVSGVVPLADERRNAATGEAMPADSLAPAAIARLAAHAADSPTWTGATAEDAERHLGGPLHVVEGLPVESTSVGVVDGAAAVRVVQMLPGGERLEIVEWRSDSTGADTSRRPAAQSKAVAPEAARTAEIAIVRDGVAAVVRAAVPADSLAALARKIP